MRWWKCGRLRRVVSRLEGGGRCRFELGWAGRGVLGRNVRRAVCGINLGRSGARLGRWIRSWLGSGRRSRCLCRSDPAARKKSILIDVFGASAVKRDPLLINALAVAVHARQETIVVGTSGFNFARVAAFEVGAGSCPT